MLYFCFGSPSPLGGEGASRCRLPSLSQRLASASKRIQAHIREESFCAIALLHQYSILSAEYHRILRRVFTPTDECRYTPEELDEPGPKINRNFFLLVICQGLFLTNNVTLMAVNGLVGLRLASTPWLATLPIMMYVVGSAVFAGPVASSQRLLGRKLSFQIGLLVAAAASAGCAWAAAAGNFPMLLVSTFMAGFYGANASLYRFAAPELVSAPFKVRAISWVMAGGIFGAVAGPNLSSFTKDFTGVPFVGAYLSLVVVATVGLVLMSMIEFPPLEAPSTEHPPRSLRQIAGQPRFIIAVSCAALGFGVMSLLMAATPIAMDRCGFNFGNTALVLQWHVLGMFVPSFFTGTLIRRLGIVAVLAAGVVLMIGCVMVALSGQSLMQFLIALLLLGVGWNFLYVGGSTLLTETYEPHEKTTAQGAMDFCVFLVMAVAAASSGALVTSGGWQWMNLGSLLPSAMLAVTVVWLALLPKPELQRIG